jgi:hypothetical protein
MRPRRVGGVSRGRRFVSAETIRPVSAVTARAAAEMVRKQAARKVTVRSIHHNSFAKATS